VILALHTIWAFGVFFRHTFQRVTRFPISVTDVGFEVLAVVVMKKSVFWTIPPCSSLKVNGRFRGTSRPYFRGWRARHTRKQHEARSKHTFASCVLEFQWIVRSYIPENITLHNNLSNPIVQRAPSNIYSCSADQGILRIYETWKFVITTSTKASIERV
jgi:hypothetical protein